MFSNSADFFSKGPIVCMLHTFYYAIHAWQGLISESVNISRSNLSVFLIDIADDTDVMNYLLALKVPDISLILTSETH